MCLIGINTMCAEREATTQAIEGIHVWQTRVPGTTRLTLVTTLRLSALWLLVSRESGAAFPGPAIFKGR